MAILRKPIKGIITNVSDCFGNNANAKYMSNIFLEKVFIPCKDMEFFIPEVLPTLNEYVLPEDMDDNDIQKNTNSKPMSLQSYWLDRYILLVKGVADKNKVYVFRVQVGDKVITIRLFWSYGVWYSNDVDFNYDFKWLAGTVFVLD